MSSRVAYSTVSTDADRTLDGGRTTDEERGHFPGVSPSELTSEDAETKLIMTRSARKWKDFPGRNRFCCDGRIMTSKQSGIFYLTCALILITTGLFLGFDCPYLVVQLTPAVPVIAVLLLVFVMSLLFRTALTDPGIIPRATPQEVAETERRIDVPGATGTLQLPPRTKEVLVRGTTIKLKYCFTCKIFRPPRASHCGVCDNCVERFDHHCPWVGNCIGKRNYRYFYLFLVALSVDCMFILSLSITTLVMRSMHNDFLTAVKDSPASMIEAIVAFLSVWSVFGLAGFHTYLSVSNITTNEDIKSANNKSTNSAMYSHSSMCQNYCEVICGPAPPSLIDRRGRSLPTTDENPSLPSNNGHWTSSNDEQSTVCQVEPIDTSTVPLTQYPVDYATSTTIVR